MENIACKTNINVVKFVHVDSCKSIISFSFWQYSLPDSPIYYFNIILARSGAYDLKMSFVT